MALELHFVGDGGDVFSTPVATIVLNRFGSAGNGLPCVITDCMSMAEFEAQVRIVEQHLARLRQEAKFRFEAAGISN
ncbi:MAG TPA: hypothetical protein VFC56_03895 [Stellaceae bacterium]|nr:hypothetical protein [Stellaceae bacterium]